MGFSHGLVAGFESHFPIWALKQVFFDARCCVNESRYVGGCVEFIVCVDVWCEAPGP